MRAIPTHLKKILEAMPRMKTCEASWSPDLGPCEGRIEWHHVWIYAGAQINELWAILGACTRHHAAVSTDPMIKEEFERRSLEIATEEDLAKYSKKSWRTLKKWLGVRKLQFN